MYSLQDHRLFIYVVPQFGNLRIEAYLQLPAAYRSLSRPSSAPDAKAFTLCSFSLELPLFSLSCLSSHIIYFTMKKHFHTFYFLGFAYLSICGQIVVFHDFRKDLDFFDLNFFLNPVKLSVRFSYLVFNEHSCFAAFAAMVGPSGVEPPTSCLSGMRSNLLSYEPISGTQSLKIEQQIDVLQNFVSSVLFSL